MDLILGFDPGGEKKFGWCICQYSAKLPIPIYRKGTADHAAGAVAEALTVVSESDNILGAGIDAPMFWTQTGNRAVDRIVRKDIMKAGANHASGTVQHINSLRGACLVQGMMAGMFLRKKLSSVKITESHPKAALWMLRLIGTGKDSPSAVKQLLAGLVDCGRFTLNEHERDAAIGSLSAWAMLQEDREWRNLYSLENNPIDVIPGQMAYWMPKSTK